MDLCEAVFQRNVERVQQLLETGANPNVLCGLAHVHPLDYAATLGDTTIVQLLLDYGAKITDRTLYRTVRSGHVEMAKWLLDRGADPNDRVFGNTMLMAAIRADEPALIRMFWEQDVHARNDDGETALFEAARRNNLEVMKALAARGACIYVQTTDGRTPLMETRDVRVVEWLLEQGADPNATTARRKPVIFYHATEPDIVKVLLLWGAEPDSEALVQAITVNRVQSVALLFDAGAMLDAGLLVEQMPDPPWTRALQMTVMIDPELLWFL